MFYYKNWEKFCSQVKTMRLVNVTASDSLKLTGADNFIVLKHDVEMNVSKALRLAEIEHKNGLRGSYYVQGYLIEDERNVRMLRYMQNMGHEISYHYDVLDANSGDYERADRDFKHWLERFRKKGFSFNTICQHGNPVKKRVGYTSNRDFFRNPKIRAEYPDLVDMVVDYSKHIHCKHIYISDAGYTWKHFTEPETSDLHPESVIPIDGFENLKNYIETVGRSVVLSTHPHRWEQSPIRIYYKIIVFKVARNVAKIMKKNTILYSLMNRFYFLAKKI